MEKWKQIKGFEGIYEISNLGRVRRWRVKSKKWFYLKASAHSGGYLRVKLRNKGNDKDAFIHRLVSEAFLENLNNFPQVNHLDSDKTNNDVKNLEWCNSQENVTHAKRGIGTSKYVGVRFVSDRGKWQSRIMINGVRKHLGNFKCETMAHFAYLKALRDNNIQNKYA